MRNRIVEIVDTPARLRIERRQLVVQCGETDARVPLEDLAVLIVANPQVSFTQAVLAELASAGGIFISCDSSRLPVGMLLPVSANSVQTERFARQTALRVPKQKRLWQQVVRSKILMQAALLLERCHNDAGLPELARNVRSGDPSNIEGQAARRYWTRLFGSDFRRDRDAADHNCLLNYGYAVLRAAMARAICAAGLHPSVGVHHHNRYNAWCLADDLMEPYRPLVDRAVCNAMGDGDVFELDRASRQEMLQVLTAFVMMGGEICTLFEALSRTSSSLANVVLGNGDRLELPQGFADAQQ